MRFEIVGITISCALILTLIAIGSYIVNAPGETREVSGGIVSFKTETSGSDIRVDHWHHVRLDNGLTVSARVSPDVPVKVGQRVNLIATKMPIIGIERFRFKEFIKPLNPKSLLQN
jgi:hypothetical protein